MQCLCTVARKMWCRHCEYTNQNSNPSRNRRQQTDRKIPLKIIECVIVYKCETLFAAQLGIYLFCVRFHRRGPRNRQCGKIQITRFSHGLVPFPRSFLCSRVNVSVHITYDYVSGVLTPTGIVSAFVVWLHVSRRCLRASANGRMQSTKINDRAHKLFTHTSIRVCMFYDVL